MESCNTLIQAAVTTVTVRRVGEVARSLRNAKRRLKISFFNHGPTDPFQEYDDAFR